MTKLRTLVILAAAILIAGLPSFAQYAPSGGSNLSRVAGRFVASNYNYPSTNNYVITGNTSTGTTSITVQVASIKLPDGRVIYPFNVTSPIIVGGIGNQELVTPTAVSNCYTLTTPGNGTCVVTASFSNTHGFGEPIVSGSGGLDEAIYDAFEAGGGLVAVDLAWANGVVIGCTNCYASPVAAISSAIVYPSVSIEDDRDYPVNYWNPTMSAATFLAVPTTLTSTTVGFAINGANSTGGTYTGTSTYHVCIAYVDLGGQEGACSSDFSGLTAGTGATNQIGLSAPAASTGAVGYTVYISVASGTYSLAYQVPLSASVCTLTKIEFVTPACAVTNSTYGQTGSAAIVSALTVNTSPVDMQLGGVSGTLLTGNPNGRTTYGYALSNHLGANGLPTLSLAFTAGGIGSATPVAIGTVNLPAQELNNFGYTFRVCGKYVNTDVNASVQNIGIYWDAAGSNTAGSPVKVGNLNIPAITSSAASYTGNFCETFTTTVAGSSVTAGSVLPATSFFDYYLSAGTTAPFLGGETATAAVASLNLAGGSGFVTRLSIVHTNTTGNNTPTLQNLTIEVL